jgi:hypothetical protein
MQSKGEIVIYQTQDGKTELNVSLKENTVWLDQKQMALLFDKDDKTISKHIQNIFKG